MNTKNNVIIKSSKNGIQLEFDPAAPFMDILDETAKRFHEGKYFFKSATVALYFKGRVFTDSEENAIINVITENSDLNVICLIKDNPATNEIYVQAIEAVEKLNANLSNEEWAAAYASDHSLGDIAGENSEKFPADFELHVGDLKDHSLLKTPKSLLLIGDIDRTSTAVAGGSIIVIGKISGIIEAGQNRNSRSIVASFEMNPSKLSIAGISLKTGFWGEKIPKGHNDKLKIAYLSGGKIIFAQNIEEIRSIQLER